jgi:hypothetical protein
MSQNRAAVHLASLNEEFTIKYKFMWHNSRHTGELKRTWAEIFKIVGPNLYSPAGPAMISHNITSYIRGLNRERTSISVNEMDADTVKLHLAALGLLKIEVANKIGGGLAEFVTLTEEKQNSLT